MKNIFTIEGKKIVEWSVKPNDLMPGSDLYVMTSVLADKDGYCEVRVTSESAISKAKYASGRARGMFVHYSDYEDAQLGLINLKEDV